MARLNEPLIAPQPSAETIEAVKRRFLRQNRELAKINSQQSIRIRTLENDCSRLLAENLSLREQLLALHNSIESRPAFDHIDAVRTQLEAKLSELGGLVAGLSNVKHGSARERGRRKSQATAMARRRSGAERQWRSGLGLQDVENGMMPTIVEDKHYPRRTTGADELREILEYPDSQSPDIGPPPVSRFEDEDAIAFDPNPESFDKQDDNGEAAEPALSVNLETRKKRRESGPRLDTRRVSVFDSPPDETEEAITKPSRTGAKRKFNVQEDEDKNPSKGDSFRFSRRNVPSASETDASREEPRPSSPDRPVLSSKPVNTDPVVSPKKQRSSLLEKSDKLALPASKPRSRPRLNITRNAFSELPPLPMPEPITTAEIILESLPPKTPAVEDIFSPPSTEPSTQRPENKDTPPPGDLISSDPTGQAGRAGRRARPQVSYKEPSLTTKMRRPDAKLVDAIVDRRTSVEPQTATIKSESNGELSWKPVPPTSILGRDEEAEVGSPLRQKLDRRDHDARTSPAFATPEDRSTSLKAISALIHETSMAKRKTVPVPEDNSAKALSDCIVVKAQQFPVSRKELVEKQDTADKDHLAVFDFTDSSPADVVANSRARINEIVKASRNNRRHSSIPASVVAEDRKFEERKAEQVEGALPSMHKRTGSGNVKNTSSSSLKKSSSAMSSSKGTTLTRPSVREKKAVAPLPNSGSSIDLRAKVDDAAPSAEEEEAKIREREKETSTLRAERAASRRKSMML